MEALASIDAVNDVFSVSIPLSGSVAMLGKGGDDVTKILKKTMLNVEQTFDSWTYFKRHVAAAILTTPSRSAGTAWDVIPLYELGHEDTDDLFTLNEKGYSGGEGMFGKTVTVNDKVYYAGSVNYTLWGTMARIIHDRQVADHELPTISLSKAKRYAFLWKMFAYGDNGETAREALAFVDFGYNGNLPSKGLAFRPSKTAVDPRGDLLDWCWEPYKPRNGFRR